MKPTRGLGARRAIALTAAIVSALLTQALGHWIILQRAGAGDVQLADAVATAWFSLVWVAQPVAAIVAGMVLGVSSRGVPSNIVMALLAPLPIYLTWLRPSFSQHGWAEVILHCSAAAAASVFGWYFSRRLSRG